MFSLWSVQAENIMLAEKHKIEREQNDDLRNQVALLLKQVQDQKLQSQQHDSIVESLQVVIYFEFLVTIISSFVFCTQMCLLGFSNDLLLGSDTC